MRRRFRRFCRIEIRENGLWFMLWRHVPSGLQGVLKDEVCVQECLDDSYRMVSGTTARKCEEKNGVASWSGLDLLCEKKPTCGEDLGIIAEERNVEYDSGSCGAGSYSGDACALKCKDLHVPSSGSAKRTCGDDGQWSGGELSCKPATVTCVEDLEATAAARNVVTASGTCAGSSEGNGVVVDTTCVQKCVNDTYQVKSGKDNAARTCKDSGAWSGDDLVCEKKPSCPDLQNKVQSGYSLNGREFLPRTHTSVCTSAIDSQTCSQSCPGGTVDKMDGMVVGAQQFIDACEMSIAT